jgi:DNA-binding transcriptional LysR family regulator
MHVARAQSLRAASLTLHVAPSAISRAIQQLEDEIGLPLFERTAQGLNLTAAGQIVLAYGQRWEHESAQLLGTLKKLGASGSQIIRIATIEAATYALIPNAIAAAQQQVQGLQIELKVGHTTAVVESVVNDSADIGVVINLSETAPVRSAWTIQNRIGAMLPPGHRLSDRNSVKLEECLSDPLILPEEGLVARSAVQAALATAGPFEIVATCNRIIGVKSLVRAGLGISFVTWLDIAAECKAGEFVFVELEGPLIEHSYVSIITSRSAQRSGAAELLIETLREAMPISEFVP